ncbi:MAG: hypothetical protein ING65_04460 [Rhodocyclaceae bacterium]|nr:hypothetical protein [Rhodocyclaceae bacterium]
MAIKIFESGRPCPHCSAPFIPWKVWAISRWHCIQCPACGTQLNRRTDLQFVFIVLCSCGLMPVAVLVLAASPLPWFADIVLIVAAFFALWLIDVFTVRLVVPGKRRPILGYET